jgi:hypothetical protein
LLKNENIANLAREQKYENTARKAAGGLMIGTGTCLIIKA